MHTANPIQGFPSALPTFSPTKMGHLSALKANSSSSSSTSANDGGIGATFLTLLTQELQNQDPTNPIDSTAMVGQMISLNQLDQLIHINQIISGASTTSTDASASGAVKSGVATALGLNQPSYGTSAQPKPRLPFDSNTLMPLDPANPTGTAGMTKLFGLPASIFSN